MRVNSGVAKGIQLNMPSNAGCRPTSDKLKEAIFSSIGEKIINASVLDLFAGSGQIGIESLSRHAKDATIVEKSRAAADTIKENLSKTGLEARIVQGDALTLVPSQSFDYCFADPPYEMNIFDKLLEKFDSKTYVFEFSDWKELESQLPNEKPSKIKNFSIMIKNKEYIIERFFKFGIKKAAILHKN